MPPCCGLVCLILGLSGLVLFCVGFAMPYWATEPGRDNSSHGLWQQRACQSGICTTSQIGFGITSAFEAGRVFSCAVIAMAVVSFIFTVYLVKRPTKAWAIRACAVWACTAIFNLLEAALIGATEQATIDKLAILGLTTTGGLVSRLDWGYWVTVASLAIFTLVSLSCGIMICTDQVDDDDDADRRKLQETNYQESVGTSILTTKTGAEILNPSTYNARAFPIRYGNGAIMQPHLPAAMNIDNQPTRLNALEMPHYMHPAAYQDDYNTMGSGKFILNNPTIAPSSAMMPPSAGGTEISILKQGEANQNSLYSFNVTPSSMAVPAPQMQAIPGNSSSLPIGSFTLPQGQFMGMGDPQGPPGYSVLPHNEDTISPMRIQQPASLLYPNIRSNSVVQAARY